MAEAFLGLPHEDRLEALRVAADRSGRPPHLLEKDVWVVWALEALSTSPFAGDLVFKGGTSLSKAYGVIQRFSEDVDLTYSIRALIPDLVGDREDALPDNKAQQRRWTKYAKDRLPKWVAEQVRPHLERARGGLPFSLRHDGEKLFLDYQPTSEGEDRYVRPSVMLEFGGRSTGEPATYQNITCDAATYLEELIFPIARTRVMRAERTFWEKATAMHVFCLQERLRGDRFARHWYDLTRLDRNGIATPAIADRKLANQVARHKALFIFEKASDGSEIDYTKAVNGALRLVPGGAAFDALARDYQQMVEGGLLLGEAEDFQTLMVQCDNIALRANAAASRP